MIFNLFWACVSLFMMITTISRAFMEPTTKNIYMAFIWFFVVILWFIYFCSINNNKD